MGLIIIKMEEIINILIDFYNGLGMPFKFVRRFFVCNKSLLGSSYQLNIEETNGLIKECGMKEQIRKLLDNPKTTFLVFQRKRVRNGLYGWGVLLLDANGHYLTNKSVFCESNKYAQQYNYLLSRNFVISVGNVSL